MCTVTVVRWKDGLRLNSNNHVTNKKLIHIQHQRCLQNLALKVYIFSTFTDSNITVDYMWIQGRSDDGKFLFTTGGGELTYTKWRSNYPPPTITEPLGVAMSTTHSYKWMTFPVTEQHYYVCDMYVNGTNMFWKSEIKLQKCLSCSSCTVHERILRTKFDERSW